MFTWEPEISSHENLPIWTALISCRDNFGAGTTLNLNVQAQNNGGSAKSRRDISEEIDLQVRAIEDELELLARGGLFCEWTCRPSWFGHPNASQLEAMLVVVIAKALLEIESVITTTCQKLG